MNKKEVERQPFNLQTELSMCEIDDQEVLAQTKKVNREYSLLVDLKAQKEKRLGVVQEKIKSGEVSTGNKIKDFVLVWLNGSKEREEQVCGLEKQLKKHQGEFVLVKRVKSEQNKLLDEKPHWIEDFRLGVIKDNEPLEINMEQAELKISSNNSLSFKKDKSQGDTPYETCRPVSIHNWELTEFGKTVEERERQNLIISRMVDPEIKSFVVSKGNKDFVIEIFIGDQQVFKALKNREIFPFFKKTFGRDLNFEKHVI